VDSPYNTYRYPGLPPGPIASPGRDAIRAVLQPADVRDLYFVSRNDGSHEFTTNLADHNRAVTQYQRNRGAVPPSPAVDPATGIPYGTAAPLPAPSQSPAVAQPIPGR
jgi:hypothetical protein